MKKTYQNPEIKVVTLKPYGHILTQSMVGKGDYDSNTTNIGARRDDFDFEDFDEEY